MNAYQLLIAAALSACSSSVFAQWQWVDEGGRKVFSDRPPPAHISPEKILQQPQATPTAAGRVLYPSATNANAAPASKAVSTPASQAAPAAQPQAQIDLERAQQEAQKAEQDKAQEAAQRQAEEIETKKQQALQAQTRKENCTQARAAQVTLQSGIPLGHINAKGERGFMSEQQRQAEMQRAQKAIKDNCV